MKSLFEVLEDVSRESGRNAKKDILRSATGETREQLMHYLQLVFGFDVTFNVTDYGRFIHSGQKMSDFLFAKIMLQTFEWLAADELKGNDARAALRTLVAHGTETQKEWLDAALARHLNIGISASSIDDVFPGLLEWCEIRQCQTLGEDDALDSDREWIAESKFDGWRCFLTKEGSDVVAYSSGGKRIGWYKEPDRDMFGGTGYICRVVSKMPFDGVLDGEVVGRHWQEAASAGGHAPDSNLVFQAFDLLPYGSSAGFSRRGWWRGLKEVDIPLAARKDALRDLLTGTGQSRPWFSQVSVEDGTRVLYVKHEPVVKPHDPEYVHEIARRHIGQYGYEGVIFKARDSIYTPVRADDWLKFKEQGEAEFMLVDMNEGNGKIAGKLGALIVEDPDTKVQVRVGEGMQYEGGSTLDDEERDRLWRNRASILKDPRYRWVTVVFQKRTSDGSVRHPRFKGFREYRSGGAT